MVLVGSIDKLLGNYQFSISPDELLFLQVGKSVQAHRVTPACIQIMGVDFGKVLVINLGAIEQLFSAGEAGLFPSVELQI